MHKNFLRLALLAVLSILVLALAACGDDDDSEESTDLGPDPVTMAPSDAPFYTEFVVRPEGSIGDDLNSALSKLLGEEDPGAKIREALDEELASDPETEGLTYSEDVEPWLGTRAGFFVSGFDPETEEPDAAAAVAVTDADAAQTFIDETIDADDATETDESYEGVDYKLSDDTAVGISGDFLVVGNQAGFEAAIDAGAGESLADNADATAALDDAPDNSLFSLYVDTPAVVDLVESSGEIPAAQLEQIDSQLQQFGDGPIEAWGTVTDSTFAIGGSAPTAEGATGPSDLLAGFPSEAWLAFAGAGVGEQLQTQIEQFQAGFEAGFSDSAPGLDASDFDPLAMIEQQTGINLQEDFAWIGDAGGFVQGTSIFGLGGGLVLEATDEDAAAETLDKVQSALESARELRGQIQITPSSSGEGFSIRAAGGLPIGAEVALQDGKVVVAIGADSVDDVVSPSETLDGSDRFSNASEALGDDATANFFLDFAPVVELIEGSGQASSDPDYQMVQPYLSALDYIVSGSSVDGDRTLGSIVLGVKEGDPGGDVAAATITP